MLLMLSDNFVLKGQDLISNELGRGGRGWSFQATRPATEKRLTFFYPQLSFNSIQLINLSYDLVHSGRDLSKHRLTRKVCEQKRRQSISWFRRFNEKSLISFSFLETEWDSKGGNWVSNVSLEGWRVGGRCGGSRRRGGGGVRKRCACLKWCTKKDWMGVVVTFSLPVTTVTPPHLTLSVVDPSFTLRPPLHKSIWLLPLPDTDNEGY